MIEKFDAIIEAVDKGGAYVRVPFDIKERYNKGRLKVTVLFDEIEYTGSIVNMGVKNEDGSICYIIGILKSIRKIINKDINDSVEVTLLEIHL